MHTKFVWTTWIAGRGRAAMVDVIADGLTTEYRWIATGGSEYSRNAIPPVGWTPERLEALALALHAAGVGAPDRPVRDALPDYRPGRIGYDGGHFYYIKPGQTENRWAKHFDV